MTDNTNSIPVREQVFMYSGILIGVFTSYYLKDTTSDDGLFSWKIILSSVFISLMVLPQAFQRLNVPASSPFAIRFGLFVQSGFFWESIIDDLAKV